MWLWDTLPRGLPTTAALHSPGRSIALADFARASILRGRLEELRGRAVVIAVRDQLNAALLVLELDGVARRMVLCPPDLKREHLPHIVHASGADTCVFDDGEHDTTSFGRQIDIARAGDRLEGGQGRRQSCVSEWILLTSGTTGVPKLVLHTLSSLSNALIGMAPSEKSIVWSTFYDIRRYGGLQVFLRAIRSGSLVLSSAAEPVADFLARAGEAGVTRISGTPTHWRCALMSGAAGEISPEYVRLSGEVADQAILDSLRTAYPRAGIAHAFASTEAGVAFEVNDGCAGFPEDFVSRTGSGVELKIESGSLHIRSRGTAICYLGQDVPQLKADDGFVSTGDRLDRRDGRYYFAGRTGGVINVGGLKVHPEEVEAFINSLPWVRMSLVRPRRSPITGSLVMADVVIDDADEMFVADTRPTDEALKAQIIDACRRALASHKVPAIVRIVPALEISASGKLVRPNA